jgi:N12 class adenine-specific DNA methylase
VSIAEKASVNLDFMSELSNIPTERLIEDLQGVIYKVPFSDKYVTADEYLSGNIREKLKMSNRFNLASGTEKWKPRINICIT